MGITNNPDTTRSQSFSYDSLNRIATAKTSATSGSNCWGETYTVDQWANLTAIGAVSGYTGCTQESLSVTALTNNQLSATGFAYDAAGNMTGDSVNTYGFNAESEIKSAAGVNYTYDGDGNRVQKSNGKIYWYGAGTEILDESDSSVNITDEYVFFGGKRVAHRVVSSGSISYYAEDFLGSSRAITTSTGTLCYDADFTPYGGERVITNTCAQNYKFEGKERDIETNNDDFGARYYTSKLGRWLSADWSSVPTPVPYANLANPQTLNLYAMVRDNPETFADLDGHDCPSCEVEETVSIEEVEAFGTVEESAAAVIEGGGIALAGTISKATGVIGLILLNPINAGDPREDQELAKRDAARAEQKQQKTSTSTTKTEPEPSTAGAGARKGGGRDEQKVNENREKEAKKSLGDLRKQRDALKSKANKTPEDKAELDRLNRAMNRQLDRMKKSETHSKKQKGPQQ